MRCSDDERRARLVARHHLGGSAPDAVIAVRSVVAMHSSDPATPHLGVLARVGSVARHDLEAALYDRRTLWRLHAMRRTLFVVPWEDARLVQGAAGRDVARAERRKLERWLAAAGPPADDAAWLADVERRTLEACSAAGELRTQQVIALVPELATPIQVGSGRWTAEVALGTRLLFLLALDGHLVRTRPAGTWRSSQYRWASTDAWFAAASVTEPAPEPDPDEARAALARRYLGAYGPATLEDLTWWTGWTRSRSRAALEAVRAVEVVLDDGGVGYVLPDDVPGGVRDDVPGGVPDDTAAPSNGGPVAALLPGLDPTPMGWKARDWYLGDHGPELFDRNGNVGPTIWIDGRIVGGWGQRPDGTLVTHLLEDVGAAALAAIEARTEVLRGWLDGTVVVPRFRTPLERRLSGA